MSKKRLILLALVIAIVLSLASLLVARITGEGKWLSRGWPIAYWLTDRTDCAARDPNGAYLIACPDVLPIAVPLIFGVVNTAIWFVPSLVVGLLMRRSFKRKTIPQ